MARLIKNRLCVVCGETHVRMWTIDNGSKVAVTYLCEIHGAPFKEIMEIAGDLPPDQQLPVPLRDQDIFSIDLRPRTGHERPKMVALDWTPPGEEPAAAPDHRAEPEPEPKPGRGARVEVEVDSGFEPKVEPTVTIVRTKSPEQIAEETTVAKARADGKTWTEVAALVGTSRQNVHQKYGKIYNARGRKLPEDAT